MASSLDIQKSKNDLIKNNALDTEANISPSSAMNNVFEKTSLDFTKKIIESDIYQNPAIIFIIIGVFLAFMILFNTLGVTYQAPTQGESGSNRVLELIMWGIFIFLILINGLQFFLGLDVKTAVMGLFSKNPELKFKVDSDDIELVNEGEDPDLLVKEEVFHIGNNKYNYKEAKAVCKAYNAELADYNQLEKAYMEGAEWCSYGWSKDQLALFPTQKATYERLKAKSKCGKGGQSCGRPGINGGFFINPNIKFGVNCYGKKPDALKEQERRLARMNPFPKTKEEIEIEKLAEKYKKNLKDMEMLPYNRDLWRKEGEGWSKGDMDRGKGWETKADVAEKRAKESFIGFRKI